MTRQRACTHLARPRRRLRRVVAACAVVAVATVGTTSTGGAQPPSDRGSAGANVASSPFLDGLAALHSFEYEEAQAAFLRAQREAPAFALAYWGEALTYHQSLWGHEDLAAGRRALAKLGPTATARAARAASAHERGLLQATELLFGDGDETTRRRRYADGMAALHAAEPDDADVASLYALALLGTMSRSLIGSHEGHSAGLAGSDVQRQVGAILGRVLQAHPRHAGALHYLIHNYDDPEHARLALEAARTYATVAPQSSHALHMPAHVFVQLGQWAEAEASDRAAYAASEAWVAAKGLPAAMKSFHALQWRQYELLQLGRVGEARALIDELRPVVDATKDLTLLSDLGSMRARQVVESRAWATMANERNFANVNELCAIGFSAARSGNAALAELARQGLASSTTDPRQGDLRPAIAIMERQVAGVMALAAGRTDEAIAILSAASTAELALPPPLGLPIPVIPAPELLGEALLEAGRPADAVEAFQQALGRNANRTRSVLGAARALTRLGRDIEARERYRQVLQNYERADDNLPEIAEARLALATTVAPARRGPRGAVVGAAVGTAIAAGFLVWRRRRGPEPAPAVPTRRTASRRRK